MKKSPFYKQAELMLKCIPAIDQENIFALKGGTAINMFVRPLPRLSVDIDLTYVSIEDRKTTFAKLNVALQNIATKIEKTVVGTKVQKKIREGGIVKLIVVSSDGNIKIEPNEVLRGTITKPQQMDLVKEAEELFGFSVSISVVSVAELYGGKICAALDRQHPRDLFDIKILMDNEGLMDEIRKAFLVFLSSCDRPMHELIIPTLKDISESYEKEFQLMIAKPISLKELYDARAKLIEMIGSSITTDEKKFLISLQQGNPEWSLLGVPNVEKFPGIQWKLLNVRKIAKEKNEKLIEKLQSTLKL